MLDKDLWRKVGFALQKLLAAAVLGVAHYAIEQLLNATMESFPKVKDGVEIFSLIVFLIIYGILGLEMVAVFVPKLNRLFTLLRESSAARAKESDQRE